MRGGDRACLDLETRLGDSRLDELGFVIVAQSQLLDSLMKKLIVGVCRAESQGYPCRIPEDRMHAPVTSVSVSNGASREGF
jgi:hypothetical protein